MTLRISICVYTPEYYMIRRLKLGLTYRSIVNAIKSSWTCQLRIRSLVRASSWVCQVSCRLAIPIAKSLKTQLTMHLNRRKEWQQLTCMCNWQRLVRSALLGNLKVVPVALVDCMCPFPRHALPSSEVLHHTWPSIVVTTFDVLPEPLNLFMMQ